MTTNQKDTNQIKMAAYWRSPYREPSGTSTYRRSPNHSTLKFEQSLHLSRARSSINFGRPDLFDPGLRSSSITNSNHSSNNINPLYRPEGIHRSQTNTTIKSILKNTKPPKTNSIPMDGVYNNIPSGDAVNENELQVELPVKKDKKRVRFGGSQKMILNLETELSMNQSKSENNALKRLSHSRLIEETAMKKLNRLIAGVASDKPSILPSVKGKGFLSQPRSRDVNSQPSTTCSHSNDLRCIRCIKKDVDDFERIYRNESYLNLRLQSNRANNERIKSTPNASSDIDQTGDLDGTQCRSPVNNSASHSSKRHSRLLPGRYPFTSGAMQIKRLLAPEQNNDQNNKDQNTDMVLQSSTTDLRLERAYSVSSSYYLRAYSDRSPSPRMNIALQGNIGQNNQSLQKNDPLQMPAIHTPQPPAESRQTNVVENNDDMHGTTNATSLGHVVENNASAFVHKTPEEVQKPTYVLGDEPPKDKTSEILEWLNDVQRTNAFPATSSHQRAIAVESQ